MTFSDKARFFLKKAAIEASAILQSSGFGASAAGRGGLEPLRLTRSLVMNAEELRAFGANTLVSYGAHTISHRGLARLPLSEALEEISGSVEYLEKMTGRRPSTFAYPYGDGQSVSTRESNLLKDTGLPVAVTTRPGTILDEHRNGLTMLPRVSLNSLYQKARYVRALASGLPFRLAGR